LDPTVPAPPLVTRPFVLNWAATFCLLLSIGTLLPVLPLYAKGPLDQTGVGIGLAVAMASPTAFLFQPLAGRLGDRRGRRLLIVGGGLVAALAIASYTSADSLGLLVALRLLTGVGEAFIFVGTATVVNDLAPDERRGEALSLYSLAVWGGLAVGPLLGELVLGEDRYDAVWLTAAACALLGGVVGLTIPETRPAAARAPGRQGGLVSRAAVLPGLALAASMIGFAGFASFVPLYAREIGMDGAGAVFALNATVVVAIRSLGRRIPDRAGPKRTATLALVLVAAGFASVAALDSPLGLYAGTAVLAVGQALVFPALMTLAVSAASVAERSAVVGSFSAFADLGFAVGAISLGAVESGAGATGVFAVAACVAAIGLLPLSRIPPRRPVPTPVAVDAPP
jgi:MFS family permease